MIIPTRCCAHRSHFFLRAQTMDLVVQDGFEPTELDWWQVAALWTCCCGAVAIAWAIWGTIHCLWARWTTRGKSLAPLYASQGTQTWETTVDRSNEPERLTSPTSCRTSSADWEPRGRILATPKKRTQSLKWQPAPKTGGQINHPARHGEESPASVVGGGQTKRVVGGEREREASPQGHRRPTDGLGQGQKRWTC